MRIDRIALGFASALLLLGTGTGQQTPVTPESQVSQESSGAESQSAPCKPQAPTATAPFDTCKYWPFAPGPGIHAPRALHAPDPQYPEAAEKAKIKGSVVLAVAISEKGHVDDVKVVRSSDRRFEKNAIDAVKQWEFAPATKDGKPVAVQENVEMGFDLY